MDCDAALDKMNARIDEHPKATDVDDIISDLNLGDLALEAAGGYSRKRRQMLDSLKDKAKARLYEETESAISEAEIQTKEAGNVAKLFPDDDTEYPERVYWLDRWVHFRTASEVGQIYVSGKPAIKLHKDSDTYELGFMRQSNHGTLYFQKHSEEINADEVQTYLRQSRESHEEHPNTHRNIDVLCDGWERLLDEALPTDR